MADLKIDFDLLNESSASLNVIHDAFDTVKSRAHRTESDWGSHAIASAMDSFAGDWDHHRRSIMESIKKTKDLVDETVTQFSTTEQKLAGSLHQTTHTATVSAR